MVANKSYAQLDAEEFGLIDIEAIRAIATELRNVRAAILTQGLAAGWNYTHDDVEAAYQDFGGTFPEREASK